MMMATLGSSRPTRVTQPTAMNSEQKMNTLHADASVLKYVGKNMIQIEHVTYIVMPICFASLKFLGKLRVLKAKTVQRNIRRRLKHMFTATLTALTEHTRTAWSKEGYCMMAFGASERVHTVVIISCTPTRPMEIRTCDIGLIRDGLAAE